MDDDHETFDMTFMVEQQGDGPRRLVRSIETNPDGLQIVTEYEEALGMDTVQHGEEAYPTGEGAILVSPEAGIGAEIPVAQPN